MKLRVGLLAESPMWEQLLAMEGVAHAPADPERLAEECSVLVVTRALSDRERNAVERYLGMGGAILAYAEHVLGLHGIQNRQERIDYIVGGNEEVCPDVRLMDLGVVGKIPREANCFRTQENVFAAFAGQLGAGHAVILPFDAAAMMADGRFAHKNFYSVRDRLPSERVSLVSKGEIARLLHHALVYLHHVRGVPYVHVWYFPDGERNVFAFRIDSDKGSKNQVDALTHIAVENDVSMSWFLDVKSHEEWLQHFAFLTGQEIGVHCYEHMTYSSFDDNYKNIAKAKRKLEQVGLSSPGFAAPFGIWNPGLAKAIDKVVFEYSSEFSYAYDTFPFYPVSGDQIFLTPEIPIHPICIGSLRRIGYSEEQMKAYFQRVIDEKLLRDEPLFFYHHPTHQHWDVVRFIFKYVQDRQVQNMTMLEFARWWRKRLKYIPVFSVAGSMLTEVGESMPDDSVWLRVINTDGKEGWFLPSPKIDLESVAWATRPGISKVPEDIRRIREFDPRRSLGNLFMRMTRRRSEGKANE